MNAALYRDLMAENLLQSTLDIRLGRQFIFQQDDVGTQLKRMASKQLSVCP